MVDAGGPFQPRSCNTVGLQNLGDVEGWDEEGEGLYLFELKGGVYVRVAMPEIPPVPVRWWIDYRLQNPFIFVRRNQRVTKWQNSGTLLASLIPRDPVKLRQILGIGYALSSQGKKGARMQLYVEGVTVSRMLSTPFPPESTIVCLVGLGTPPAKRLKLTTGVEFDWDSSAAGELVGVVIRIPGSGKGEPPYLTRKDDVRVTVGESINFEQIHTPASHW